MKTMRRRCKMYIQKGEEKRALSKGAHCCLYSHIFVSDLLSTAKRFALFPGPQGQTHYFERPFSSSYHIDENWFCRWERKREKEKRSLKRGGAVRRREQRGDGDGWKAEWGGVLLCLVLHTANKHRPRCFTISLGFVDNVKIPNIASATH
mmetsp:Transcript_81133/g.161833  ORF Transcript_81133/g.161833 Transcript_81133/m.161833 type:complete len:150 (+) Transcript_81133:626-1075(+)